MLEEINTMSDKLSKLGYIDNRSIDLIQIKDSTYSTKFTLGKKIKLVRIYIGIDNSLTELLNLKTKDTITLPYQETDYFLNQTLKKLEESGFALASLKLINLKTINSVLYGDLKLELNQQRKLNSVIIRYSDSNVSNRFPKGHLKQISRKYQDNAFNQNIVDEIYKDFEKFNFVNQVKYPEILFKKDSTKVYVYLEKRKSNTFDGFIGFSNNENNKVVLNGYLDVSLENILGSGEQFSVYWKSDGNDQKTFKAHLELPYLLQTPLGLKAEIQLFRQDSTFQNTKTAVDLSYFKNYNTRFYLGYQTTESSDIQNLNNASITDFNNSFVTARMEYTKLKATDLLFPIKTRFLITTGFGKRTVNTETEGPKIDQFMVKIDAMHNFQLNKKNSINLNSQNFYLHSNQYVTNELHRFGGFNSMRGFTENSLYAYFLTSILTEYRYLLSPELYIHSILDYSIYKDTFDTERQQNTKNLLGLGVGFGLLSKNGLFKLAVANGTSKNQEINFCNTIVHICYNVKF